MHSAASFLLCTLLSQTLADLAYLIHEFRYTLIISDLSLSSRDGSFSGHTLLFLSFNKGSAGHLPVFIGSSSRCLCHPVIFWTATGDPQALS